MRGLHQRKPHAGELSPRPTLLVLWRVLQPLVMTVRVTLRLHRLIEQFEHVARLVAVEGADLLTGEYIAADNIQLRLRVQI